MLTQMEGIRVVGISDIDPTQLDDVKEGTETLCLQRRTDYGSGGSGRH